jgi:hypothetical protein
MTYIKKVSHLSISYFNYFTVKTSCYKPIIEKTRNFEKGHKNLSWKVSRCMVSVKFMWVC